MKLVIASNNQGKIREIKAILGNYFQEVLSQSEAGLDLDVEETGSTFVENALIKARAVSRALNCAALADDSGLCVDALGGAPGVYSARYAGEGHDDAANRLKLIEALRPLPGPYPAHFACAMALCYQDGREVTATGEVHGEILLAPRGDNGFGYDPLFYYPPFGKTFAEAEETLKNAVSHRKNALEALKKLL